MGAHQVRHSFILAVLATYVLIFSNFHFTVGNLEKPSIVQDANLLESERNLYLTTPFKAFSVTSEEKMNTSSSTDGSYSDFSHFLSRKHSLYFHQGSNQLWWIFIPYLHGIMPHAP
jgi:hypothetical protein